MAAPLSMDLRVRIVRAVEAGQLTKVEIAERLQISRGVIYKLLKERQERGTLEPQLVGHCGRQPIFTPELDERLRVLVEKRAGVTLEEIRAELALDCCLQTICTRMHRLGLSHKKTPARGRAGSA